MKENTDQFKLPYTSSFKLWQELTVKKGISQSRVCGFLKQKFHSTNLSLNTSETCICFIPFYKNS